MESRPETPGQIFQPGQRCSSGLETSKEKPRILGEDLRLALLTGLKDQGKEGIFIRIPDCRKQKALLLQ